MLLGDSTMAETAHDLAILLSGIATDSGRLHEHVNAATRVPAEAGMQRMQMPALGGRGGHGLEGPVDITFRSTHRDMEISLASLNISIVTRYIGKRLPNMSLHAGAAVLRSQPCWPVSLRPSISRYSFSLVVLRRSACVMFCI